MATAAGSRKILEASVWYRGGIVGPLTAQSLSALLLGAAATPEVGDIRCQVRCTDGFSLRLYGVGDEGFESDEGDGSATGSIDDRSQDELRVSDHAIVAEQPKSGMAEEDSSSANSSCSDTEDPNSSTDSAAPAAAAATAAQGAQVIHGADMLFCHTDPAVPCGVLFVTRQPRSARIDNALEAIILRCSSEAVAKDIYTSYLDITRRLKWERYTNSKRKKDVIRASFRNVNFQSDEPSLQESNDIRNLVVVRPGTTTRQIIHERDNQPPSLLSLPSESERRLQGPNENIVSFSGPHSLPECSEISRILSLSTPEDGWTANEAQTLPGSHSSEDRRGRTRHKLVSQPPIRYSHNKGPAPALPATRQHPTNPNLLLVPTKNGLEPYRVISCDPPPRPLLLSPSEFSPRYSGATATLDWTPGHKSASQFDTNNNRSRAPARQPPLFWVPGAAEPAMSGWSGSRRPELRRRARSKSPGERHRGFELAGALSSAIRGIKGQLRRAPAEAPPAVPAVNPKSVMKKRDRVTGSPETKRVTFSAYSTVQVMD